MQKKFFARPGGPQGRKNNNRRTRGDVSFGAPAHEGKSGPRPQRPNRSNPKGSWEQVSEWYGEYVRGKENIQHTVVFPNALRLLAPQQGASYLDIACGEGAFTQMVAKRGAEVTGVDIASSLVRQAQDKRIRSARFQVGDAQSLPSYFEKQAFDGATCILALQNIPDLEATIGGAAIVLKRGASLVAVINHPSFRTPRQSGWEWDEKRAMQFRRVDAYMTPNEIPIAMYPGRDRSAVTYSYHRPLEAYIKAFAKAGFVIDALEEWTSEAVSDSGPRAKAENRARREIPLFLAIRARKQ